MSSKGTTIPIHTTIAPAIALHYGSAQTPLAEIIRDHRYPAMWRVRWANGSISNMVNISRAKDAAMAMAERGPPARNWRRLHWERSERPTEASPAHFFVRGHPRPGPLLLRHLPERHVMTTAAPQRASTFRRARGGRRRERQPDHHGQQEAPMRTARTIPLVPAPTTLKRARARIDRNRRAADRIVATMRDQAQALHVSHEKLGDHWWLSNGIRVTAEAAKLVIAHPDIVSVGDGLFHTLGQTYRHI
jgi:hypothetical protein